MTFVLALDQGTTSSRALLFAEDGSIAGMGQREYPQMYPQPGWVEHDPMAIWESQLAVAREALAAAGISASELSGIGIANQRETTLLWERRTGNPVCNAIVWQDRRTAEACERLRAAGHAQRIRAKTGLEVDAYFSATKLAWMLDHVPGARERAQRGELAFGTVDSWLVWKLTGGQGSGAAGAGGGAGGAGRETGAVHATDVSNASRTMLFDIHRGGWDEELLGLLRVPREVLPEVRATDGGFGETAATWLGAHVPIRGVIGDQQAALLGQGCTRPGMVKCTYGTGCFLLMHTGTQAVESKHRLLTTVAWQRGAAGAIGADGAVGTSAAGGAVRAARNPAGGDDRRGAAAAPDAPAGQAAHGAQGLARERTPRPGPVEYALEGSVFSAGAVVQWLRDGLGIIRDAAEIEPLARSVPDSGGVLFVPAFTGLGAPHWDPHARGTIVGITRGTTRAHLARAALEAIAHQVADVVEAMAGDMRTNAGQASPEPRGEAGLPRQTPSSTGSLRVDGGAASNDLLLQLQADLLGTSVQRCCTQEATAAGAALAGGIVREQSAGETAQFDPKLGADRRAEARQRWADAVGRAR